MVVLGCNAEVKWANVLLNAVVVMAEWPTDEDSLDGAAWKKRDCASPSCRPSSLRAGPIDAVIVSKHYRFSY